MDWLTNVSALISALGAFLLLLLLLRYLDILLAASFILSLKNYSAFTINATDIQIKARYKLINLAQGITPAEKLTLLILTAFLVRYAWLSQGAFLAGLVLVVLTATVFTLAILRANRRKQVFIQQLPEFLRDMATGLRAGYSLSGSIEAVVSGERGLAWHVFTALLRAEKYLIPTHEAARNIAKQLKLWEWDMVVDGLEVANRQGFNLPQLLDDIAGIILDKLQVDREMASLTSAGRFSGLVIAMLAPITFAIFYFFAPVFIEPVLESELGRFLLVLALVLEVMGCWTIWKITQIRY